MFKYSPVDILFKNDAPVQKVTDKVVLQMNAKRELYRIEPN